MKKIYFLVLLLIIVSFAGCAIAPTSTKASEVSSVPSTSVVSISFNNKFETWVDTCFNKAKTDAICFEYSEDSEYFNFLNSYLQEKLEKSSNKPCYYSLIYDGANWHLRICFKGIFLKDIFKQYSLNKYSKGVFVIRTASSQNEIANCAQDLFGKNIDLAVRKLKTTDGNLSYYEVTLVS